MENTENSEFSETNPRKKSKKVWFIIGGIAGIIAGVLMRKNIAAEAFLLAEMGLFDPALIEVPASSLGWLELVHNNFWVGLLLLDFFDVVNYLLVAFLYIALYLQFRKDKGTRVIMSIVLLLGLSGIFIGFITNPTWGIVSISNQYYSIMSASERANLLSKAGRILTLYSQTESIRGFWVYLSQILFASAGLLFSLKMKKTEGFKKWNGVIGIIGHSILLAVPIPVIFIPDLIFLPFSLAAIFILLWHTISGIKLLQIYEKTE